MELKGRRMISDIIVSVEIMITLNLSLKVENLSKQSSNRAKNKIFHYI